MDRPFAKRRKSIARVTSWASPNLKVNDGRQLTRSAASSSSRRRARRPRSDRRLRACHTRPGRALNLASRHPDAHDDDSLPATPGDRVSSKIKIRSRIALAGIDGRAKVITSPMRRDRPRDAQRLQAAAHRGAFEIVEGAVTLLQMALNHLAERKIVELTRSGRPRWSPTSWSLCSDRAAQAVINSGTIWLRRNHGGAGVPSPSNQGITHWRFRAGQTTICAA